MPCVSAPFWRCLELRQTRISRWARRGRLCDQAPQWMLRPAAPLTLRHLRREEVAWLNFIVPRPEEGDAGGRQWPCSLRCACWAFILRPGGAMQTLWSMIPSYGLSFVGKASRRSTVHLLKTRPGTAVCKGLSL